ncbi:hypothetical protein N7475_000333 [Penicillium sp. IBT 31633x]|nr:hypothetical protein N7475_000333 [Penicillium sp. IBT 31633x]
MAENTEPAPPPAGPPVTLDSPPEGAELEPQGSDPSEPFDASSLKRIDTNATNFPDDWLNIPISFKNVGSGRWLFDPPDGYLQQWYSRN